MAQSRLVRFSPAVVRRAAHEDPAVAEALLRELADRALAYIHEITGSAFTTVRERIARHLLDLAAQESRTGGWRATGADGCGQPTTARRLRRHRPGGGRPGPARPAGREGRSARIRITSTSSTRSGSATSRVEPGFLQLPSGDSTLPRMGITIDSDAAPPREIAATAVAGLRAALVGEVVTPRDEGYDDIAGCGTARSTGIRPHRPCAGVSTTSARPPVRTRPPPAGRGPERRPQLPRAVDLRRRAADRPATDERYPRRPRRPDGRRAGRGAARGARRGDPEPRLGRAGGDRLAHRAGRAHTRRRHRLGPAQVRPDRRLAGVGRRGDRRRRVRARESTTRTRNCSGDCGAVAATSASSPTSGSASTRWARR